MSDSFDQHLPSPFARLQALETAYYGLEDAANFDERSSVYRVHLHESLASIILSDELEVEVDKLKGFKGVLADQTISEICNRVFGSEDYTSDWKAQKLWLGTAIVVAS